MNRGRIDQSSYVQSYLLHITAIREINGLVCGHAIKPGVFYMVSRAP